MRGYIYILRTEDRPKIIKVGKTTKHPNKRCNQHNKDWYLSINTWEVCFWRWVENCHKAEKEILTLLKAHNLKAKHHREAFNIDSITAKDIAIRVCDKYPPKSDKKTDPIIRKKKRLDQLAYLHISTNGKFSEQIISNHNQLAEEDYYNWLYTVSPYLDT